MGKLPKMTRIFNRKKYKLYNSFFKKSWAQEKAKEFKASQIAIDGKHYKHARIVKGKSGGKPIHHLYVRP
jgi:hypothetical protein